MAAVEGDARARKRETTEVPHVRRLRRPRAAREGERENARRRALVRRWDVWSFGVTTFLMLGGYHLFDASREAYSARLRMDATLQREFAKPAWTSISPEAKRALRAMLRSEASERVAAEEVLRDPWPPRTAEAAHRAFAQSPGGRIPGSNVRGWARAVAFPGARE